MPVYNKGSILPVHDRQLSHKQVADNGRTPVTDVSVREYTQAGLDVDKSEAETTLVQCAKRKC